MAIAPAEIPAPLEPTTPIKPSEAIRLGTLVFPVQSFQDYYSPDNPLSACALGAMYRGFGLSISEEDDEEKWDAFAKDNPAAVFVVTMHLGSCGGFGCDWPMAGHKVTCPSASCTGGVGRFVPHLNDEHRWTRERIADWLAEQGL